MNPNDYISNVLKTESTDLTNIKARLSNEDTIRLLHAAMGMVTESAEFLDALKKHVFYGKTLDTINLLEELGDQTWYQAVALSVFKTSFEFIFKKNIDKLKARYGDKFTETAAINRNLDKEYSVLSSNTFNFTVAKDDY